MYASLLDMLHDAADYHVGAITDRIHVHLDGVIQEAIQQHRRVVGHGNRVHHVVAQLGLAVDDFHGTTTQHIGRTHHQRVTDFLRQTHPIFHGAGGTVGRLLEAQLVDHLLETLPVFCLVNGIRRSTDNGHTGGLQGTGQLQRRLAAVLHDHTLGFFLGDDGQHVFQGHRLKIQAIGSVVIRGHGLRVTVDHDGLVTVILHGEGGMHTAVIELDPLTDPVGATTDDHDLVTVGRVRLALFVIAGVHVGGVGGKFRRTGIHSLVDGLHTQLFAFAAHVRFLHPQQLGQTGIGEPLALECVKTVTAQVAEGSGCQLLLGAHQIFNLHQIPAVDLGDIEHIIHGHTDPEGITDDPDPLRSWRGQQLGHLLAGIRRGRIHAGIKAHGLGFQTAQGFLYGFLEVAANGHHFAHGLHLGGQHRVGFGELFKVEARNLGNHVIDGRLERGRSLAAGDLVLQFI